MQLIFITVPNKFFRLLQFISCVICFSTSAQTFDERAQTALQDPNKVIIAAHRACWSKAPENSLISIADCIALGIDIVELDIRKSKDGVLVVIHDKTLDRTTNGAGLVADFTISQLKKLQLTELKHGKPVLTEQRIPTLEEVFQLTKDKILINIDAKEDVFAAVHQLALQMGVSRQIIFKLELPQDLQLWYAHDFLKTSLFMIKFTQHEISTVDAEMFILQYPAFALEIKAEDQSFIQQMAELSKKYNYRLWINTLSQSPNKSAGLVDKHALHDPTAVWGSLLEMGVSMIQTDHPAALLTYLQQINRH
ncbi:glycerophosphodiester phosphodiesterase family protein [Rheinheimera gaetbuli]